MIHLSKTQSAVIVAAIAAIVTLALRLSLIAYPPTTDEGCYVFHAAMAQQSDAVLPTAPINFYASIVSLVGQDADTPYFRPRLFDAIIATLSSAIFGLLLLRWVHFWPALIASLCWAFMTCNPTVIDGGFKNPITAATFVYLITLLMITSKNSKYCFVAGALIPFAAMIREAFMFVPLVTTVICFLLHDRRAVVMHIIGGLSCAAGLLLWLIIFYGSPLMIINYYIELIHVTGTGLAELTGYKESALRRDSFKLFVSMMRWLLIPLILGVISICWNYKKRAMPYIIALLLILPTLPEIFGKSCFPYHLAQLSLGLSLFAALGLHHCSLYCELKGFRSAWIYGIAIAWAIAFGQPAFKKYQESWALADKFAPVMIHGDWDDPVIEQSFYTAAAKYLRDHTNSDDRIITSGFYYALYPLANRKPAEDEFVDVTFSTLAGHHKKHTQWVERLRTNRPTVVIESLRFKIPIKEIWPDFEQHYVCEKTFPKNKQQHYGAFGAKIWRLRK